jgi:splicing factor 3A subunit 1
MIGRTMAQKKMAAMIMEDTAEEVEAIRAKQAVGAENGQGNGVEGDANMAVSDDEETELSERKRKEEVERIVELEKAKAIQATSMDASGPMKIRTDYVPKRE